jgi:hypothetical protein
MAALSHLRREEKLGLGIAVAAHLALFAALIFEARREAPVIPPAERMTVSLASDVSLESTAPNPAPEAQAAVAPVLAPESQPLPAPVTTPVPRQVDTPPPPKTSTSKPTVKPQPEPKPKPSKKPGGTRIGDDFLKGIGASERADTGAPAASFGSAERASLQSAINRQLKPFWKAPEGVDVEKLDTTLTWDLNPDGSLKGRPRLVSQTGKTASNAPQQQRHVEQAIRAVQLAAPFNLPEDFYDHWKRLTWHFDRNLSR